ncbi:CinA family protein [Gordonia sp. DT101]|uniref:CinA family protein n=1 Tax=Gordonia sp. DT101 TaxID=3416545 RepID=UPI003CF70517
MRIGVAESLTGGNIAASLSRASGSGNWFSGGIVAYHPEVKFGLLDVPDGPVVCATAAEAMARNAARLLGADLVVAVTGEAGPDPQEDEAGTVCFGIFDHGKTFSAEARFAGEPAEIVRATVEHALRLLLSRLVD